MDERIFISYKRVNKERVLSLKDEIENALGVKCWIDLEGIETSAPFFKEICNAIDQCDVMLFMHSSAHLNIDYEEDWTVRELKYALDKEKRVALICLDKTPLRGIFEQKFGSLNNIDSTDSSQRKNMLRDLRKWLDLPFNYKEIIAEEQCDAAIKYHNGINVPENKAEAIRLYREAAENGSIRAQMDLSFMYYYGIDVIPDEAESAKWCRRAAEQGDSGAQYILGDKYKRGDGVSEDRDEARRWFQKAADQGDEDAKEELRNL